jgi:hypothetical protein
MRSLPLLPTLAALAALAQLNGCGLDRRTPPAERTASADSVPLPPDRMIRRADSMSREMHRSIDSILDERGITMRREGDRTVVTAGGRRVTFDASGNMGIDSIPAEAPDAPETRGLQPDLGTGGIDAFVPAEEAVWGEVARFSGAGQDATADFSVRSREFRVITRGRSQTPIPWRTVEVQNTAGRRVGWIRLEEPGADTSYVHDGPGVFRLVMKRFQGDWQARVEEKLLPAERMPDRNR